MTDLQDHYVPVLKVKRGEKRALREIHINLQQRIIPLLEIVELNSLSNKTLNQHLNTAFRNLAESVHSYSRCFLDCRELQPDWPLASEEVFLRATSEDIVFTPVTGISRNREDVVAAMNHRQHGLALRLTRQEFEIGALAGLKKFLQKYGLTADEIDLIVDLGPVDSMIVPGVVALAAAFLRAVPSHTMWRTVTITCCGFPSSMSNVQLHSHDLVQRVDWVAWRDYLYQGRHTLERLPRFSDCAIQHTAGVEGFDPRIMQVSASVRYTWSDYWLLIKGESTRRIPATVQFPVLATSLVYGHLQNHFYQESHCNGCASIQRCADWEPGHASPETWRRFGTIHHITRVVEELATLP